MVGMKFEKIKAVIDIFVDDNEISIGMTLKYRLVTVCNLQGMRPGSLDRDVERDQNHGSDRQW